MVAIVADDAGVIAVVVVVVAAFAVVGTGRFIKRLVGNAEFNVTAFGGSTWLVMTSNP